MTLKTTALYIANADTVTASDLRAEYAQEPGGEFRTFDVIDADDSQDLIQYTCTALIYPDAGRVGIASNSCADWADYDGTEGDLLAAIDDYLNDAEAFEARN